VEKFRTTHIFCADPVTDCIHNYSRYKHDVYEACFIAFYFPVVSEVFPKETTYSFG